MTTGKNEFTLNGGCDQSKRCNHLFAVLSLLVMLLIIYENSFFGEWHFDDYHNIVDNRNVHLQGLSWQDLRKAFFGVAVESEGGHTTRPLAYLSFGLNYLAGGTGVFGYHVVNFVIHFAAAVFLFLFICRTLQLPLLRNRYEKNTYGIALLATFFWATSPLQVNAVTYIVQRMASMAGLGYIMALYFYVRTRTAEGLSARRGFALLCVASSLLAFGSKENAAMLPISILLYDVVLIQGATRENMRRMMKYAWIPLAVILIAVFSFSEFLSGIFQAYEVRPFTLAERLLTAPRILIFYITLLLYPIPSRLSFLHDIDISRSLWEPWTTVPALLAAALFLVAAVLMARRRPLLSYCMLFFFLNHLIEGTIIPLELIFEHRNYIPSMLFFVPIAVLMLRCLDYFSYRRGFQVFMAAGFALLLAFQGQTTFERNDVVQSDTHLWLDNVRKAPGLSRPHINLGNHYAQAGMYDEALAAFTTAISLDHDTNLRQMGLAHYNLGLLYLNHYNDDGKALGQFVQALEKFPDYPPALSAVARLKLRLGHRDEAYQLIREKLENFPHSGKLLQMYGLILLKKGDYPGAVDAAKRALERDPKAMFSLSIMGEAYRHMGKTPLAILYWRDYLAQNTSDARAHLALIELYRSAGEGEALRKAVMQFMYLKGEKRLTALLEESARNPLDSVYVFHPADLHRIIRSVVLSELK